MAKETARHLSMPLEGARVVVQGFGNVGSVAARMLQEQGCKVVALSDASGGVYRESGLDVGEMVAQKRETPNLGDSKAGDRITNAELLELPCDVLVLAAMEGQITEANASKVKAKIIVEGANGPTSTEADKILVDKGVFIVPDILANAGGVIVSYFEWVQDLQFYFWEEQEVEKRLDSIMKYSFESVLATAEENKVSMRMGAYIQGVSRVVAAHDTRGIYP